MIVDDDDEICLFFETILNKMDCRSYTAKSIDEAENLMARHSFDICLLDLELPDGNGLNLMRDLSGSLSSPEIIIITGTGDVMGAETAFKYGAWDFVQKPFQLEEVSLPINRAIKYRKEKMAKPKIIPLKRHKITGESHAIRKSLEEVGKAASTNANVIITGETGTGKELFSRAIHENSSRASKPFIAVDCGALTETLIESTLFGHEKGAFTGATSKQSGLIVQADGGTLMLDEIGDMPMSVQKTLLRTLQEKTVRSVGGKKDVAVDIRLVSATNLDLQEMVEKKLFRQDLYYRIGAIEIKLPPLRDRGDDIHEITLKKVHELSSNYQIELKAVSTDFLETIAKNSWPGNIRELINVLEFSLAAAGNDPTLVPKHLPPQYRLPGLKLKTPSNTAMEDLLDTTLKFKKFPSLNACKQSLEKKYLELLLRKSGGDRKIACELSGISQARLYALLKQHELPTFSK